MGSRHWRRHAIGLVEAPRNRQCANCLPPSLVASLVISPMPHRHLHLALPRVVVPVPRRYAFLRLRHVAHVLNGSAHLASHARQTPALLSFVGKLSVSGDGMRQ
jgi:hypothetical protein